MTVFASRQSYCQGGDVSCSDSGCQTIEYQVTPPCLKTCVCMQMVLKCADIGHLAVDPKTHKRWAFQLEEEFFRQVLFLLARSLMN